MQAKKRADEPPYHNYEVWVDPSAVNPDVGPIFKRGVTSDDSKPNIKVYSVPQLGLEAAFYNGQDRQYYEPLHMFTRTRTGNEVEVDSAMGNPRSLSKNVWDHWKTGYHAATYSTIYRETLKTVNPLLAESNSEETVVVDLFGGDGEFIGLLRKDNPQPDGGREYHIVDANNASLRRASEWFSMNNVTDVTVHKPRDLTSGDIFAGIDKAPDLVTAIGGINRAVITRYDAVGVAHKVYEGLRPGGRFVVTGLSLTHLNAEDFTQIGFLVDNMAIPDNAIPQMTPSQMYVLTK